MRLNFRLNAFRKWTQRANPTLCVRCSDYTK